MLLKAGSEGDPTLQMPPSAITLAVCRRGMPPPDTVGFEAIVDPSS